MICRLSTLVLVALAAGTCGPVSAETVYRCGNEYSRVPCASAGRLEVGDATTLAQRAEARAEVLRAQQLAESMARERRAEAAALHPAAATSLGPIKARDATIVATKSKPASRRKGRGDSRDDAFVVRVPRARVATAG